LPNTLIPKRDEETVGCRKLHNEELHKLYSFPSIIRIINSRRMRWAGHVARMWENRNAYRILVGKPEGKRPLGTPRHRWDQWKALVNTVLNLRVLQNAGNFLSGCTIGSSSRRAQLRQ
jgi:hypothetical protein